MTKTTTRWLALALLAIGRLAYALPVELKDSNGTRYQVNTEVSPLISDSLASGAVTNATFQGTVTVTDYWYVETFFGGTSTFTTKYTVNNVPMTPAFVGFNGIVITGINGTTLGTPLVFNTGQPLAGEDCPDSNNVNQELLFPSQSFTGAGYDLAVTRKVFVPHNKNWLRWLNIFTNNGTSDAQLAVTLRGLIASGSQTKITATNSGGSTINASTLWFTSAQTVPQGEHSYEPRIGYVLQNTGGAVAASSVGINSVGQAAFSYNLNIPAGQSQTLLTFVTVQGKTSQAKSTCEDIVTNPLPSDAIKCMNEVALSQVVNFPKITPPTLTNATVKLKFNKTDQDTVQWKGKVTIGAGIDLDGLPVVVDFGGNEQTFILNKSGSANNGGGNKFNLNAKLQNGVTKAKNVSFSFNMKGDLQSTLAAYGLTDATVSNVPVTIPLTFTVGTQGAGWGVDQAFTYNATQGKSGTAKAPPSS